MQPLKPFNIFLVDDEPFCLQQLDKRPDLIFLDYNMDAGSHNDVNACI